MEVISISGNLYIMDYIVVIPIDYLILSTIFRLMSMDFHLMTIFSHWLPLIAIVDSPFQSHRNAAKGRTAAAAHRRRRAKRHPRLDSRSFGARCYIVITWETTILSTNIAKTSIVEEVDMNLCWDLEVGFPCFFALVFLQTTRIHGWPFYHAMPVLFQ